MTTDQLDADLDRLRAAHARIVDPDPDHVRAARRRVLASGVDAAPHTPSRGRRLSRRSFAGAAGALAVAAVAVVALLPGGASDTLDRAAPVGVGLASAQAAAERACSSAVPSHGGTDRCLQALSVVAGDWNPPGTGEVLYQRTWRSTSIRYLDAAGRPTARGDRAGGWGVSRGAAVDAWVAPDGSGRTEQLGESAAYLPSAADRAAWQAAGSPALDRIDGRPATGRELEGGAARGRREWGAGRAGDHLLAVGATRELLDPTDPLAGLSTDPALLLGQLRELAWRSRIEVSGEPACAKDLHDCETPTRRNIESAFGYVAVGLLTYPATPRPLREALLAVLARLPGYRAIGPTTLPDGRRGAGVLLPPGTNDGQDVLVIATDTARPIAQGMSGDRTLRTTRWTSLFAQRTARVAAVGDRPAGR